MNSELAAVARRGHGVFRCRDALAAGYSPGAIRHLLRRGEWWVVRGGVYAEREDDARRQQALRVHARRLTAPDAVGSHAAAAVLHRIPLLHEPMGVTVTRPPGRSRRARAGFHIAQLPAAHRTVALGAPVTTAARTVVDLLRTEPPHSAVTIIDGALREERTHVAALRSVADWCDRWPGIVEARRLIEFGDGRAETALESISRWELDRHGVEPSELQVWVRDLTGRRHRADFYWARYRTIGEADGLLKYTDPSVLRAEKLRQENLERAGFHVVRWTWGDITQRPAETAARVIATFARAAA